MIQAQIEKAVALWFDVCCNNKDIIIPEEVQVHVHSRLKAGKVPPIFHAYCAPTKRLYDTEKCLCPEKVVVGHAVPGSTGALLSRQTKTRYDDDFFLDGEACEEVDDNYLQDTWTYCPVWTATVVNLVNAEADMVGANVEVTRLHGGEIFPIDREELPQTLMTRPLSRGVVADCFGLSKTRKNMYSIVGTPGIGKSWTLVYALQQALLYDDVCVVICFQKSIMALACIRKQNQIFVWKAKCPYPFFSNLCNDPNVLVLLDPLEAARGGAQYVHRDYRLICAGAENDTYSGIEKDIPHHQRFLGPYTQDELSVALPYLRKDCSDKKTIDCALKYTKIVGMLPRSIRSKGDWELRKQNIEETIMWLKCYEKELKLALTVHGAPKVSRYGRNKYDSTIFAVSAAGTMSKERTLENVGYDGQLVVDYGKQSIDFVSDYVREQLTSARKNVV